MLLSTTRLAQSILPEKLKMLIQLNDDKNLPHKMGSTFVYRHDLVQENVLGTLGPGQNGILEPNAICDFEQEGCDSSSIGSRRSPKKLIPYVTSISIDRGSGSQNKAQLAESNSEEHLMSEETRDPLWQRLQNLEAVVTEMVNKPTTIPPEKEDILHESLNRIKSIEYDLQKTKKALFATASKQVELAECLESLKEDKYN
ncbi:Phosphatidylinositol/phosphatidylcholine transfer protein SFH9 [Senna tora]|uniref:Phosphatidylinositol/phosphatidylcholine transfer protein SFH9 n=1 Tax=Senna tora TaxID=362788 RepID=A0A834WQL4_9FABA|nr:Phosphatidylinositol/phosphatidylcholine transfer protein SFH9 [Senna tora]